MRIYGNDGRSATAIPSADQLPYVNTTVPGGNTIANTASETAFTSSYTFAANSLAVGDVIRVTLFGTYGTDAILAPTIRGKLKLGGATILDTTAITAVVGATNRGWSAEAILVVQSIGASGAVDAQGFMEFATAATTSLSVNMANTSTFTVDTTASLALTLTAQWGTANTTNTLTLRQMVVEKLRQ